ncbi:hypothetical protein H310_11072 [Aphanomyces invadans]|uniref:Uncharacterized protein n=1 Tax=Aphanomyces invadans TaxID=157072 RepID=A0A024TNQ1_9STRA|nr:hypothetical protein H310_11072 [Aphanomyces invadans]ETV95653.1 hypothetical protein H310_11072 [Aphanomyces invadans]|eukprot:XP_008875846.1 hypothetical protein H310_11072 [Aphanomyces invadans]
MARMGKRATRVGCDGESAPSTDLVDAVEIHPHDKIAAWREKLKKDWLFDAPDEFFAIHSLAAHLNHSNPSRAFVEALSMELTGPFDVLSAAWTHLDFPTHEYLHGRCYYDPPEVITVARSDSMSFGYFRDDPSDVPKYVVKGRESSGSFDFVHECFAHVLFDRLEGATKPHPHLTTIRAFLTTQYGCCVAPASTPKHKRQKTSTSSLASRESCQCRRRAEQVAPTLSGLGIVVPVHAISRIGFRDLPVTHSKLRKLLEAPTRDKAVDDLITRATIACDECDFGTALQLGLDLWTQGAKFEVEAVALLESAYMMLRRIPFGVLARRHVEHRRLPSSPSK